jgi:3-oxoacyl-(acyl-carrier-protein) synthase
MATETQAFTEIFHDPTARISWITPAAPARGLADHSQGDEALEKFCLLSIAAAKQALADASLEINESNAKRIGISIGSGVGGLLTMETQAHVLADKGPVPQSPPIAQLDPTRSEMHSASCSSAKPIPRSAGVLSRRSLHWVLLVSPAL